MAITVDQPFSLIGAHVHPGHPRASPGPLQGNRPGLTIVTVWPYRAGVAAQTMKTTYALDVETVRTLERVARRWGVSRSEALRRAIRVAARDAGPASDVDCGARRPCEPLASVLQRDRHPRLDTVVSVLSVERLVPSRGQRDPVTQLPDPGHQLDQRTAGPRWLQKGRRRHQLLQRVPRNRSLRGCRRIVGDPWSRSRDDSDETPGRQAGRRRGRSRLHDR